MRVNVSQVQIPKTHEGAQSSNIPPIQQLRRSVLACMLWEDSFYEDGVSIADRIAALCAKVKPHQITELAKEAHEKGLLRHAPLWLITHGLKHKAPGIAQAIYDVCTRPDQMTELLAMYWKKGKTPLAKQLKKGLAKAFGRFDEYQLAKYNRDAPIKLRDIMFLCHPKPKDAEQADLWARLANKQLKTPDTWETRLSAGEDKKESFQQLLEQGKMGKLAIIRNLRNMADSGVPAELVKRELLKNSRPILPFQWIAAANACPQWEPIVDEAMIANRRIVQPLKGRTVVFVDVSGSMRNKISGKSQMSMMDAASGLAILLEQVCETTRFFSFSDNLVEVPPRKGLGLRDAIVKSQPNSSTMLAQSVGQYFAQNPQYNADRYVIITDEQSADTLRNTTGKPVYVLNVGSYANGLKQQPGMLTITGFSEASVDYIIEIEVDVIRDEMR